MRRIIAGSVVAASLLGAGLFATVGSTSATAAIEPCPVHQLVTVTNGGVTVWVGCASATVPGDISTAG